MLRLLRRGADAFDLVGPTPDWRAPEDTVWIDLLTPSREEEVACETSLGIELPTLEEAVHLEPSSRLYQEDGATIMTATLLARSQGEHGVLTPVTFVLRGGVLVTIRYQSLRAFEVFSARLCDQCDPKTSGASVMLELLDAVIERMAEVLEETSKHVEATSAAILSRPAGGAFAPLLADLAHAQSIDAKARDSLVSLGRLVSFADLAPELATEAGRAHLYSLQRDVQSLTEHVSYQSGHITFRLDAALGLINIEQNSIIKIFSMVSVIFLPPTLVASIYGMNFTHMPELKWLAGYPAALAVMIVSMVIPTWWFKRKGWL
jgi:magnesium transporter